MARPYDNTKDLLVIVLDQKHEIEKSTARVVKLRHDETSIAGLNIVAAFDGLVHQTNCPYCDEIRSRISSRVIL